MNKIELELKWQETKKICLLEMLQKEDKRTFDCITNNKFKPLRLMPESSYIYGVPGNGKTVTAAWWMLEWSRINFRNKNILGNNCLFINTEKLINLIRNNILTNNAIYNNQFSQVELLVLDDFVLAKITDWVYEVLYTIINYRYSNYKTTIYTSNDSLEQLSSKLNDHRIVSRIEHDCGKNVFNFTRPSIRKELCLSDK